MSQAGADDAYPGHGGGRGTGRRIWVLLVLLLSLSCAVIAAITGSGRSEWGFVGFTGALVVGHLALPPRFPRLKGRRRLLEIISGMLAIVGSTMFFSGQRAHAS